MAAVKVAAVHRVNGSAPAKLRRPSSATRWMTRFRSSLSGVSLLLVLAGCAASSGVPAIGISEPGIAAAYIPLHRGNTLSHGEGAAVAIAPGVAVTNGHNRNLVATETVIGEARDYDLLFFRDERTAASREAEPGIGEAIRAYGQGRD